MPELDLYPFDDDVTKRVLRTPIPFASMQAHLEKDLASSLDEIRRAGLGGVQGNARQMEAFREHQPLIEFNDVLQGKARRRKTIALSTRTDPDHRVIDAARERLQALVGRLTAFIEESEQDLGSGEVDALVVKWRGLLLGTQASAFLYGLKNRERDELVENVSRHHDKDPLVTAADDTEILKRMMPGLGVRLHNPDDPLSIYPVALHIQAITGEIEGYMRELLSPVEQ